MYLTSHTIHFVTVCGLFRTAHPELHIINEVITYVIRRKQKINLYEDVVN